MTATPEQWDARVDRLSQKLPDKGRHALDWLREPSRIWFRLIAGVLLILGGFLAILPILGLWMLPLGLALISQDVPALKIPLEACAQWIERMWAKLRGRRET